MDGSSCSSDYLSLVDLETKHDEIDSFFLALNRDDPSLLEDGKSIPFDGFEVEGETRYPFEYACCLGKMKLARSLATLTKKARRPVKYTRGLFSRERRLVFTKDLLLQIVSHGSLDHVQWILALATEEKHSFDFCQIKEAFERAVMMNHRAIARFLVESTPDREGSDGLIQSLKGRMYLLLTALVRAVIHSFEEEGPKDTLLWYIRWYETFEPLEPSYRALYLMKEAHAHRETCLEGAAWVYVLNRKTLSRKDWHRACALMDDYGVLREWVPIVDLEAKGPGGRRWADIYEEFVS